MSAPDQETIKFMQPLLDAANAGDEEAFISFLEMHPEAVHKRTWGCVTPLILAAKNGLLLGAQQLLAKGADVNARETGVAHWPALHFAAEYGHQDIADLLLTHGADLEAIDDGRDTALTRAKIKKNVQMISFLEQWPEIRQQRWEETDFSRGLPHPIPAAKPLKFSP
jgi:ankyrin repeat protein